MRLVAPHGVEQQGGCLSIILISGQRSVIGVVLLPLPIGISLRVNTTGQTQGQCGQNQPDEGPLKSFATHIPFLCSWRGISAPGDGL